MKKFQKILIAALAIITCNIAMAVEIIDVQNDYWASNEIVRSIQNGFLNIIDGNKFKPEGTITRSDFVTALLKVIQRDDEPIVQKTSFKDVNYKTPNEQSVLLSEQIRMVFGYPDKTFKPGRAINHNETMAMIANITKSSAVAGDITGYADYAQIPLWAKRAYIKNVGNGLYVNYPDELQFTPKNNLTRAEAAVLFDKITSNISLVQDKYRDLYKELSDNDPGYTKSVFLSDGTLDLAPFAYNNKVNFYDNKKVIEAGNILIGTALTPVNSKQDGVAKEYVFSAPNDVYTTQGAFVYPKGTEFYARDEKIKYTKWRSKPQKSATVFFKYSLPTGETYDMAGVPFTRNDNVIYVKDVKKAKKAKSLNDKKMTKKEYMIACAHQMMPVTNYKIKENKTIYILLTGDMVIPISEDYLNLRTKKSLIEEDL